MAWSLARPAARLTATNSDAYSDLSSSDLPLPTPAVQATSLSQAVYQRRAEYTRPTRVRIKIGSWNTGAQKGIEHDLSTWFVTGSGSDEALAGPAISNHHTNTPDREHAAFQETEHGRDAAKTAKHSTCTVPSKHDIDIYVLGLQEIVDITSPTEALKPFIDPSVAGRWKASLDSVLPKGYRLVAEQQLVGLWLVIYASPLVFPDIRNVSTDSIGTGFMGYMGNKGAVAGRIVLGESTRLVFINSHLAAGADKAALDRRNWDAAHIASRIRFDPSIHSIHSSSTVEEGLGEEDFAFWFGDLNYRLEGMPGDDVRRLLAMHTAHMDVSDGSRPSASRDSGYGSKHSSEDVEDAVFLPPELDPASLQTTVMSLLSHDELLQQMKAGKAFGDGWQESMIRFLPSYKYDIGKVGVFDSSDKRRCPSWCDRILYRTRAAKQRYDADLKRKEEIGRRDEEMQIKETDTPAMDVLFDYDPDTDGNISAEHGGDEDEDIEVESGSGGISAQVLLEAYTTHMHVIGSDHKPVSAILSLEYDAMVPDLKIAVHSEVARELDRQENEGRPSLTVAVDRSAVSDINKTKALDSSFEGVDFDHIQYGRLKQRSMVIANTGQVPATFTFADRPVDQSQPAGPFPSWLNVIFDREPDTLTKVKDNDTHQRFTLEPADVINVELRIKIESLGFVRDLNEGLMKLDDVLVMHVEGGRDHFLPIRAHWLPSALARSIDVLIKSPEEGIRRLQDEKPDHDEVKRSVPRELLRLTEAIEDMTERALAEWEMTKSSGERAPWQDNAGFPFVKSQIETVTQAQDHEDELARLYEAIDCNSSFSDAFSPTTTAKDRVELLSEVLLTFLSSLTDGVITASLWKQMEERMMVHEKHKQSISLDDDKIVILEALADAPGHNTSFLIMMSFLQNITNQIVDASNSAANTPKASTRLPASLQVKVHRRTSSESSEPAIRQPIVKIFAILFADVLFKNKEGLRIKEKEKASRKERMIKVIELFIKDR